MRDRLKKHMIDKNNLIQLATKEQTSFLNVAREYVQNLFLRSFYMTLGSQEFLFKGGTAFRIVFGSPRFSEDLDFTGTNAFAKYEDILTNTLSNLSLEELSIDIVESKPTTGGHLANINIALFDETIEIKNQISYRKSNMKMSENIIVSSSFVPPYSLFLLNRKIMVEEKVHALIERGKPRDFFDLYFILRDEKLHHELHLTDLEREKIHEKIAKQDKKLLKSVLKNLFPKSYWLIIDDLPTALNRELE